MCTECQMRRLRDEIGNKQKPRGLSRNERVYCTGGVMITRPLLRDPETEVQVPAPCLRYDG